MQAQTCWWTLITSQKVGQSDLVYWVYRSSCLYICSVSVRSGHGLLVLSVVILQVWRSKVKTYSAFSGYESCAQSGPGILGPNKTLCWAISDKIAQSIVLLLGTWHRWVWWGCVGVDGCPSFIVLFWICADTL